MRAEQDRHAAHRWNVLNEVRRNKVSVTDTIIEYFRKNIGEEITGEELKYLAKDKKEWARRVRELRTEQGWPIVTKNSGREDLAIGVYVLEEDRQTYDHDRRIPDPVRVAVLQRTGTNASTAAGTAPFYRRTTHESFWNGTTSGTIRTKARTRSKTSSPFATFDHDEEHRHGKS